MASNARPSPRRPRHRASRFDSFYEDDHQVCHQPDRRAAQAPHVMDSNLGYGPFSPSTSAAFPFSAAPVRTTTNDLPAYTLPTNTVPNFPRFGARLPRSGWRSAAKSTSMTTPTTDPRTNHRMRATGAGRGFQYHSQPQRRPRPPPWATGPFFAAVDRDHGPTEAQLKLLLRVTAKNQIRFVRNTTTVLGWVKLRPRPVMLIPSYGIRTGPPAPRPCPSRAALQTNRARPSRDGLVLWPRPPPLTPPRAPR